MKPPFISSSCGKGEEVLEKSVSLKGMASQAAEEAASLKGTAS